MLRSQRGFLPPTGYIGLAALAVILALGLALKVQGARLDASKAELEACAARYAETLKLVEKQNKAVDALQADSQKRQKQAAIALKQAKAGQGSLNAEILRLRAINADTLDCSGAVQQVKQGLSK